MGVNIGMTSFSRSLIHPLLQLPHTDRVVSSVLLRMTSGAHARFNRNAPKSFLARIHFGQMCSLLPEGSSEKMQVGMAGVYSPA
jgi:hypothetical protein